VRWHPLTAWMENSGAVTVWGKVPVKTHVTYQRRQGSALSTTHLLTDAGCTVVSFCRHGHEYLPDGHIVLPRPAAHLSFERWVLLGDIRIALVG
jgi:hypothetical protein